MDPSLSQALGITTGGTLIRKPSQWLIIQYILISLFWPWNKNDYTMTEVKVGVGDFLQMFFDLNLPVKTVDSVERSTQILELMIKCKN
jgi:hypothetical protein